MGGDSRAASPGVSHARTPCRAVLRSARAQALSQALPEAEIRVAKTRSRAAATRFGDLAGRLLAVLKELLSATRSGEVLLQVVVPAGDTLAGLAGMLKTAHAEDPRCMTQLVEVEPGMAADGLAVALAADAARPGDMRVRHAAGVREVNVLAELPRCARPAPFDDGGVYLITGGAGGLGLQLASYAARTAAETTVILTGRSELRDAARAAIGSIEGALVRYEAVDVTDSAAVRALVADIVRRHGRLDGVVHAAGLLRDSLLVNKTPEELAAVLAPKVSGLANLDEATRDLELSFFAAFASATGVLGNPGQADYAAANAFMDVYLTHRAELVAAGRRHGRSVAIDWPLWADGGMRVDAETAANMDRVLGMAPMPAEAGLAAFAESLAAEAPTVLVVCGDASRIRRTLLEPADAKPAVASAEGRSTAVPDDFETRVQDHLRGVLASVVKLSANRIESDAPFEDYGIDSVMVIRLTNELEQTFGPLPKTLFFEYLCVRELARYFMDTHAEKLLVLFGGPEESAVRAERHPAAAAVVRDPVLPVRTPRIASAHAFAAPSPDTGRSGDIAIIGLAGRYPGANDVDAFWENLAAGVDSVSEIPIERWDWRRDFDPEKGTPGKTYSRWGGFLDGIDEFDPLFFGISPREAEVTDPQERIFLECAWATLEDAGYTRSDLRGLRGRGSPATSVSTWASGTRSTCSTARRSRARGSR